MNEKPITRREKLSDILREHGPKTSAQLALASGLDKDVAASVIAKSRRTHPGKCFRIIDYITGVRKPTAVYADQVGTDVPMPILGKRAKKASPRIIASYDYIAEHEKLVTPAHMVPLRNGTSTQPYVATELSYRGSA